MAIDEFFKNIQETWSRMLPGSKDMKKTHTSLDIVGYCWILLDIDECSIRSKIRSKIRWKTGDYPYKF